MYQGRKCKNSDWMCKQAEMIAQRAHENCFVPRITFKTSKNHIVVVRSRRGVPLHVLA
jgi:hypothetical protein